MEGTPMSHRGALTVTTVLTGQGGRTTLVSTTRVPSREVCDVLLQSGLDSGAADSFNRLAEFLVTLS
jgi:uncharacterized protein YndB with AHSA1/START domain